MPSSRAVLADIHNLSLDPTKAWSSLGKNGRLKSPHEQEIHISNTVEVVEKLDVEELVEPSSEVVDEPAEQVHFDEPAEQVHFDEIEELVAAENSGVFDSTPAEFSDNLDSGGAFDTFKSKKKKK